MDVSTLSTNYIKDMILILQTTVITSLNIYNFRQVSNWFFRLIPFIKK